MKRWGLGIEHEMRIRFTNKISELNKNIKDIMFKNLTNEYVFIDSRSILYYFKIYEVPLMRNFNKYMQKGGSNNQVHTNKHNSNHDKLKEEEYFNNILLKLELIDLAKKNKPFPIENKIFFDIYDNDKIKNSFELFNYYLMIYSLFNAPLLFFNYNFNNEVHMNLKQLINYNKIIDLVDNDKESAMDFIEDVLNNLYNSNYEKEVYKYIKKAYEKKNVDLIYIDTGNYPLIAQINIFYNDIESKLDINYLINMMNNHIDKFKSVFNNNIEILGIEDYKFYKNLFILYYNEIPHIDYTSKTTAIEFKTIYYENLNYEKGLQDLIDLEKTFFNVINNIPLIKYYTDRFGELIYHNIGSINNSILLSSLPSTDFSFFYDIINEDYTGSYHIWITAPYNNNIKMKHFLNIHATLANKLQLLEPILATHYCSPSYNRSIKHPTSKSSLRQFINRHSNYGTTDISLMNGVKKYIVDTYYLSEDDIIDNKPQSSASQSNIYDYKGKLILNYDKLDTRSITNNIFKLFNKGNNESNNNININNYYAMIFEQTQIRPIDNLLQLGADIRTRSFNQYFYPLDKDWSRRLLLKNNKLTEIYYNSKLNKISYERIYDKTKKNTDYIGIEFRIFDHFPTHYLNQILCILVPLVLDSVKYPRTIKFKNTYVAKQFWHNEMYNVMTKGYEYVIGHQYLNALEKEFDINIDTKNVFHSDVILSEIYNKLCNKNNKTNKNSL